MKLFPKIITGFLHQQNKGSCDWGWQGLVAYGCHNLVPVIDPNTVQIVQVLDKHKGHVVKVRWARENHHHDTNSPYSLRLASADAQGSVVVWDVAQGEPRAEFSDGNKPVLDLEWLGNQDGCRDLLVALHPPYSLILWNGDTGTRLWKKSYTEALLSFSFDPFNPRNVAFLGQDCVLFIDDFIINKTPSSNGRKYYVSSPGSAPGGNSTNSLERKSSSKNLAKRMSRILEGDKPRPNSGAGDEEGTPVSDCLQLTYHRACRHHVLLLYPRELLVLDLEINQTVGIVAMDRSGSPFMEVLPCWQRDVLMCLHENGSISMRVRRKTNAMSTPASEGHGAFDDSPPQVNLDVSYDLRCQSDPLRVTRQIRVFGAALCPLSEMRLALVMSDSRTLFWELRPCPVQVKKEAVSPLTTPGTSLPPSVPSLPSLPPNLRLPLMADSPFPRLTLSDTIGPAQPPSPLRGQPGHGLGMRFLLSRLHSGVTGHVTITRMCPPLTNKNINSYQPFMALGTFAGSVVVVNVASGQLEREYNLSSSPIRGIEWAGLKSFLCFAHPNPSASGLVKNEFLHVDILSGKVAPIRQHREEESPIESLQVSHLKQYFVLTFKEKPMELWDLRSLSLIRELPRGFPRPTAAVWSPSHSLKTLKKKLLDYGEEDNSTTTELSQTSAHTLTSAATTTSTDSTTKEKKKLSVREHFVMTDKDGTVFHFIVEGSAISDVTKIPPESGLGTVTCLAWKTDYLVFGDVEGTQCIWDLKAKMSRSAPTNRGAIKKIRFAPGKDNLKFFTLHADGIQVWDIPKGSKCELMASLRSPKDISKIVDAEWAGSDRPMLATSQGCVYIYDLALRSATTSVSNWDLPSPLFYPHLLPGRVSQLLKNLLSLQTWREEFSLTLDGLREEDKEIQDLINQQLALVSRDVAAYLPICRFGTAQRCLLTARLFGDEADLHFWTVALHYLRSFRAQPKGLQRSLSGTGGDGRSRMGGGAETGDLVELDDGIDAESAKSQRALAGILQDQPLERCYDTLCDNATFKKYQIDRLALHDSRRATSEQTSLCVENHILLGQTDRAVHLLLETDPESSSFHLDSLRACLVASVRSSGASQSTIKLVATNLIANGNLSEGVQLLCLIDKALDACRYLQTYGAWERAVWLAKAMLGPAECEEVMRRWADHLCSSQVNQKSRAVLVLLSLGQFHRVLEMLYGMRQFDTAAAFIEACGEFGLMERTTETRSLMEAVCLEYARYLTNLGLRAAAEHYCHLAGSKGQQLLQEVQILFS